MPVYDVTLTIQDIDAETKAAAAEAFFTGITAQIASGAIHVEVAHEPKDAEVIKVPGDVALAAQRRNAPADPVKAEMLAALKQIRDGAAPDGRWLDADGNAIDGHDSEDDEPDAAEWPDATWEPYTAEEQANFLASVVAIADKAIARAEGEA